MPRVQKFLRHLGIAELVRVEVDDRDTRAVFHLNLAQIVQTCFPVTKLFQVFGNMLGKQNVTGVTTIHHTLRDVNASAGNVGSSAYINDAADGAAVHAHAQAELRMRLRSAADLQRTFHGRFRRVVKHQRHTVAGWNRDQTMSRFGFTKLLGPADNLIEELKQASLLVHHQLGVTDNVDEEHIRDFQLDLFLNPLGHGYFVSADSQSFWKRG